MYGEIICIALIIVIGAMMVHYNSITDWDITNWVDWAIIILVNVSALVLVAALLITALYPIPK